MISKLILNRPKTDIRILGTLLREKKLTATEIAAAAGTSVSRVRANLKSLMHDGLVMGMGRYPGDRLKFYRANLIDNPLMIKFAEMFYTEEFYRYNEKLGNKPFLAGSALISLLENRNIKGIVFFGSSVRENRFNDIDIAILLDIKNNELLRKINGAILSIENNIKYNVSVNVFSANEFREKIIGREALILNIMKGVPFVFTFVYRDADRYEGRFGAFDSNGFVNCKMLLQTSEKGGALAFLWDIDKAIKIKDLNMTERAVTDFMYYILAKSEYYPENSNEVKKVFKQLYSKTYTKINGFIESGDFSGIRMLMLEYIMSGRLE